MYLRISSVLVLLTVCTTLYGQSISIIAQSGDLVPDQDGVFDNLSAPLLGDSGRVSFFSTVDSSLGDYDGLFVFDEGLNRTVARQGVLAPGSTSTYSTFPFSSRGVNDAGNLVFRSNLISGDSSQGVFVGNGLGTISVAQQGDSSPAGPAFFNFGTPSINQKNQIAFEGCLTMSLYFFDPGSAVVEVLTAGDSTPAGGQFELFGRPLLNEQNQMAFFANANLPEATGIFLATLDSVTTVATEQQSIPAANATFDSVSQFPNLNDVGDVVFQADLTDGTTGIYLFEGGDIVQVARSGESLPGGDGVFGSFGNSNLPIVNNQGQIVFQCDVLGTSTPNDAGIFIFQDGAVIDSIRVGTAVDNGAISLLDDIAVNEKGQVAFSAEVEAGLPEPLEAIFLLSPGLGLVEVIRESDQLLQSEIDSLSFPSGMLHNGDEKSGFNNLGQVSFNLSLVDNREAIAVWTPPVILGDLNRDCVVSLLDIGLFVALIQDGEFDPAGDINGDGIVSLLDVGPFVDLLIGQ